MFFLEDIAHKNSIKLEIYDLEYLVEILFSSQYKGISRGAVLQQLFLKYYSESNYSED